MRGIAPNVLRVAHDADRLRGTDRQSLSFFGRGDRACPQRERAHRARGQLPQRVAMCKDAGRSVMQNSGPELRQDVHKRGMNSEKGSCSIEVGEQAQSDVRVGEPVGEGIRDSATVSSCTRRTLSAWCPR